MPEKSGMLKLSRTVGHPVVVPPSAQFCLGWADGNLAEAAVLVGKMVEQSQPNPGLRADE